MKLLLDSNGNAVLEGGMPVYEHEDGTRKPLDAVAISAALKKANAEASEKRHELRTLKEKLEAYEGLDPEEARGALKKLQNIDAKKLIDAGEVDKVREAIAKSFGEKLTAAEKRAQELEQALHGELIGGGFARSKFVAERLAIPADLVQAAFGRHFSVKDGKVVATDANGTPILSRTNGQPADFDEALEVLVSAYPGKDSILRATQRSGSGPQPGANGSGGKRVMTRAQYDSMSAQEQAAVDWTAVQMTD